MEIRNILVVRFRQMGDAILATPMLSTLRSNYPEAHIDFVLNERIAPLFEEHPAIDRIITFSDDERHHALTYMKKVWHIVHKTHYDVVIDMRSTLNTMLFAIFSPRKTMRIGIRKPYSWLAFNHRFNGCEDDESMIDHNLALLTPLGVANQQRELVLHITDSEKADFRRYMAQQGIDFSRPVMLAGVTAKLASKTWPADRMIATLRKFIDTYPATQIIFNYAPGKEEDNARSIYEALNRHPNIFINIEARNMRQMAAMSANCTFYFGNEGGGRHIVQAMGRPSLVVCSPMASKKTWLPESDKILTLGIAATDIDPQAARLSYDEQYQLLTVDAVWQQLSSFCQQIGLDTEKQR